MGLILLHIVYDYEYRQIFICLHNAAYLTSLPLIANKYSCKIMNENQY